MTGEERERILAKIAQRPADDDVRRLVEQLSGSLEFSSETAAHLAYELTDAQAERDRLRAEVRRYQLNERSHYKRAASYVAKQYHEKAERMVHENVSLRGRIEALKKEHEQQVRWREADSHYWYQRGFKAERLLKEARAERDEARAEANLLRELFQEAMGWIPKVQALKGLVDSDPVKVLRPEDIKGAEGILKRRPE